MSDKSQTSSAPGRLIKDLRKLGGNGFRWADQAAAEIERLRADNLLMAQALQGITPDANTMTPAEAADRVAAVERAIERALS